ncbi:MAG: HEAT repeat domain-containing protein [Verrucomicrobia bacterium]|nr:HEAT repeat domain-containing protein [Verrucomicrobiota bacterium]
MNKQAVTLGGVRRAGWRRCLIAGLLLAGASAGEEVNDRQRFEAARKLVAADRAEEAFKQYLAIPGGEFAAVALARGEAAKFLAILQHDPRLPDSPRALLVEAELLLASGRKDDAKPRFHTLATTAAKNHWGTNQPGYYPVEPPGSLGGDDNFASYAVSQPALPFSYGPGSHRDNWLLRRLIALDLTDDAAAEFARIRDRHRANTRPYLIEVPQDDDKQQPAGKVPQLVRPPGFNSYGLQFALDHAFFLKRTGRSDAALAALLEPLRVMDMDLNPNLTHPQGLPAGAAPDYPLRNAPLDHAFAFGPGRVGVARKEFIRLAYGEFKSAGRDVDLIDELQHQIDRGENRAYRVLAQVRLHQGQAAAALALELAFIQHGTFDELSAAYRRGQVFDSNGQPAEAITAFEQVLAATPGPMQVPDAEERISEAPHHQASAFFQSDLVQPGATPLVRGEVQDRLVRLYAAVGRTDKVLETELSQFDADERRLETLAQVEQMATRFNAAGQEARFNEWAKQTMAATKSPRARANLAWQQRDYPAAMTHAAAISTGGYSGWHEWQERFAKLGREQEREFMRAVVQANPRDAVARLELLDLEDHLEGPAAIAALEALLATDASNAFPRGKGVWNRTHFSNYLDLAYRLMRLYEQNSQLDDLRALGLRLAKSERPFEKYDPNLYSSFGDNGLEEFGNACLALAIQHADDKAYQHDLAAALQDSRWTGARAQLERRVGSTANTEPGGTAVPPWANVSREVTLIASCESVTCMARDEQFVYAGQPWGVAVYDFKGMPVTRIVLGRAVTAMVATGQHVWVGTTEGLFRIAAGDWSIAHEALGQVTALALDDEQLWIGVRGGIMLMDRRTLALRSFAAENPGFEQGPEIGRFEPDRECVWADGNHGLLRYDRAADAWSVLENPGTREPVHLIGILDGQVWADVYLNDDLRHRPARVDRQTLRVTPIQLGGNVSRDQRMINERIAYIGKDQGQLVFAASWGRYVFDEATGLIRRMPEPDSGGARAISDPLPEGLLLPDGQSYHATSNAWPDGLRAGIRASAWPDRWPVDAVWAVWFDDTRRQEWLCVGAGLAVLRRGETSLRHFDSTQGLCCGPVLDGVEVGGKLCFASGWDDARGGLTVFDPQTRVFTSFFRSAGMDSNKVVGLAVKDGQLELRYGVEYLRYNNLDNQRYRQCRPGRLDLTTSRFTSGGEPEFLPQEEAEKRLAQASVGTLPLLGGPAYRRYERDGKTWICGSRGLVVFPGKDAPTLAFAELNARRVPNPTQTLREEAKLTPIPNPIAVAQLKELAAHANRYVRANALAAAINPVLQGGGDPYAFILADCVSDSYRNVRATAVWLLSRCTSDAALPPLRLALEDSDPGIRAVAALALARRGEVPPLAFFEEIIERVNGFGNFPFGADSSIGVEADPVRAYAALAPHADRTIFELLVRRPPPNHDDIKQLYPVLGEALRNHPEAVDILLAAQDTERHGPLCGFVQAIFQHAGKALLPALHAALTSKDRVVRSNAARACGAIADPSSIPPLVQALDMESGLARASIVWALGELKAPQAVPKLVELHQDARNAEHNRRAGSGYLAQQAVTASREEYLALRNLDAIASDWDEMQVTALRRPRDPRRDEELLTPELVLEAVRKIGPAAAQAFYRTLAAAAASNDRAEAAVGLADAAATDREQTLTILRNLSGDPAQEVRIRARVSLLLLAEPGMDAFLRERLHAGDNSERGEILSQLSRLLGPQLEDFRQAIEAIATNAREPQYLRERAGVLAAKLMQNATER